MISSTRMCTFKFKSDTHFLDLTFSWDERKLTNIWVRSNEWSYPELDLVDFDV